MFALDFRFNGDNEHKKKLVRQRAFRFLLVSPFSSSLVRRASNENNFAGRESAARSSFVQGRLARCSAEFYVV